MSKYICKDTIVNMRANMASLDSSYPTRARTEYSKVPEAQQTTLNQLYKDDKDP